MMCAKKGKKTKASLLFKEALFSSSKEQNVLFISIGWLWPVSGFSSFKESCQLHGETVSAPHTAKAGVRRWWAGLSKAYSRKTPSAGTQIEDFKSLDQLLNVWHFIKLNKLQNYIQIKGIKTINTYSAKHLSIAASSTVTQAWGTAVARGLNGGASLPPPHGISRTVNPSFISIPFITLFFYIHETHCKVYTNKPRALLMQQALYNEPKRARLLWEDGMSVQTLRGFPLQKHKLSLSQQPLDLHLPKSSPF